MKKNIIIINGPNLNLLGKRNTDIYGDISFENYFNSDLKPITETQDSTLEYFQSNSEGEIIEIIHQYGFKDNTSIIINAGAYTHYSIAIRDAIESIKNKVIEVHISNIYNREDFRQKSVLHEVVSGVVFGFGLKSYKIALLSIVY
jgi:3-dehydroquinate dehydratase II